MRPKPPGGSRKGKPNAKKQAFRDRLAAYCTRHKADPHYWMARTLGDTTTTLDGEGQPVPTVPLAIKIECASQLAQYLQPKLRSVVLAGDAANPLQVLQQMPAAQLEAYIQRKLAEAGYAERQVSEPPAYDGGHQALPEGTA